MTLPPVTYLTTDSLAEGIGASQVLAYVERLAGRGLDMRLHTFEKTAPTEALRRLLADKGISWHPHPFGTLGAHGGLSRIVTGARAVRGAAIVHARSDLAAASTLLARSTIGCGTSGRCGPTSGLRWAPSETAVPSIACSGGSNAPPRVRAVPLCP